MTGGQAGRAGGLPRVARTPGRGAGANTKGTVTARSGAANRIAGFAESWGSTAGRVLLGVVLAWFGYHELVQPALWTGYLPFVHAVSGGAVVLVLAHGWVLLVLAVALVAGIAARAAAGLAALLLTQIVIWLWISAGLSDLTLRDVGVLGLALCIASQTDQRLALTG